MARQEVFYGLDQNLAYNEGELELVLLGLSARMWSASLRLVLLKLVGLAFSLEQKQRQFLPPRFADLF
jgi:hypothetical protein